MRCARRRRYRFHLRRECWPCDDFSASGLVPCSAQDDPALGIDGEGGGLEEEMRGCAVRFKKLGNSNHGWTQIYTDEFGVGFRGARSGAWDVFRRLG